MCHIFDYFCTAFYVICTYDMKAVNTLSEQARTASGTLSVLLLTFLLLPLLLAGCTECRTGRWAGTAAADTAAVAGTASAPAPAVAAPALIDTLRGFVGDGTSMHVIELVSADASDTLLLELEDEADHRASLTVGREIGVVVQRRADGSQTVLATFDVQE